MGRRPRTWPSPLEKARKRKRLALKSRRAPVRRISDSASWQIAVGVTAVRDAGRAGETAASQPHVLAARSCAQPPRERSGPPTLKLYDAPRFGRAHCPMICIAISAEAFEAIARTLPVGSVGYEREVNAKGEPLSVAGGRHSESSIPPRRRCYARHGVDRPASRHAGPRSLLPRPPQRGMEARPCSSQ
jgi:hypothetical protein